MPAGCSVSIYTSAHLAVDDQSLLALGRHCDPALHRAASMLFSAGTGTFRWGQVPSTETRLAHSSWVDIPAKPAFVGAFITTSNCHTTKPSTSLFARPFGLLGNTNRTWPSIPCRW